MDSDLLLIWLLFIVNECSSCQFILKKRKSGIKVQLFFEEDITWIAWMEAYSPLKVWAGSREQHWVSVPTPFLFSHTLSVKSSHSSGRHFGLCVLWLQPQALLDDYELNCHQWRTTIRHTTGEPAWLINTFFKGQWPLRKDWSSFTCVCQWRWTFMYRMSTFIKWGDGKSVQTLCRNSNR